MSDFNSFINNSRTSSCTSSSGSCSYPSTSTSCDSTSESRSRGRHKKSSRSRSPSPCGDVFTKEQWRVLERMQRKTREMALNEVSVALCEVRDLRKDLCCTREAFECRFVEVERQLCVRDDIIRRLAAKIEATETLTAALVLRVKQMEGFVAMGVRRDAANSIEYANEAVNYAEGIVNDPNGGAIVPVRPGSPVAPGLQRAARRELVGEVAGMDMNLGLGLGMGLPNTVPCNNGFGISAALCGCGISNCGGGCGWGGRGYAGGCAKGGCGSPRRY